jgi:hypothetical protein
LNLILLDSRRVNVTMKSEIIALLFPDTPKVADGSEPMVTALLRDAQGLMELRRVKPDRGLLRHARIAGRFNCGIPIVDPETREIIGYEIEPMSVGMA